MPVPLSAEAAADAVANALKASPASWWRDLGSIEFTRARWPKYALKDLDIIRADVITQWPARMDPHDDLGTATETPIAVLVQRHCEKSQTELVDELTALLNRIATFLARTDIPGLGHPIEPLIIDRDESLLDKAHFLGGVGVVYRIYQDPEDDDE